MGLLLWTRLKSRTLGFYLWWNALQPRSQAEWYFKTLTPGIQAPENVHIQGFRGILYYFDPQNKHLVIYLVPSFLKLLFGSTQTKTELLTLMLSFFNNLLWWFLAQDCACVIGWLTPSNKMKGITWVLLHGFSEAPGALLATWMHYLLSLLFSLVRE